MKIYVKIKKKYYLSPYSGGWYFIVFAYKKEKWWKPAKRYFMIDSNISNDKETLLDYYNTLVKWVNQTDIIKLIKEKDEYKQLISTIENYKTTTIKLNDLNGSLSYSSNHEGNLSYPKDKS